MATSNALTSSSDKETYAVNKNTNLPNNAIPPRMINLNSYTAEYEYGYHENQIITTNIDKLYNCHICIGLQKR